MTMCALPECVIIPRNDGVAPPQELVASSQRKDSKRKSISSSSQEAGTLSQRFIFINPYVLYI